jgi:signal transduction histidine kinase
MNKKVDNSRRFMLLAGLLALFVILALLSGKFYFGNYEYRFKTRRFNKILHEKETIMQNCLDGMKPILATEDHHGSVPENSLFKVAEKNGITILEFLDNKLAYWSDNEFEVPSLFVDSLYTKPLVYLQNGWFVPQTVQAGNEIIVGLLRVRTEYSLKNEIIKSGFEKDFGLNDKVDLSTEENDSDFHIYNKSGQFLFSLVFPGVKEATSLIIVPILFWTVAFILALIICYEAIRLLVVRNRRFESIIFAVLACSAIYLTLIYFGLPQVFHLTLLFSPFTFSLNWFIPSLGHLLILCVFGTFLEYVILKYFPFTERNREEKNWYLPVSSYFVASALLISMFHYIFTRLVLVSNINFQPYKVQDLNVFSLVGYGCLFILVILPSYYLLKALRSLRSYDRKSVASAMIPGVVLISLLYSRNLTNLLSLDVFFLVLCSAIWITGKRRSGKFSMTVIFSFIFGLYSLFFITKYTEEKALENIKIQALSLSTDNDPRAENLLIDIWPELSADTTLENMMISKSFNRNSEDVENISDYLRETYFTDYWTNYNFNIVLCRNDQPLQVGPGNEMFPNCFKFFDERIARDGEMITGTGFYFIGNQRGRPYYLGRLVYPADGLVSNGIFIELYGDVNVFQPGYSALLLDEEYKGYSGLKDYNFAKYINGEIVLRAGEFPYNKTDAEYIAKNPDYKIFRSEGYRHLLYKNGNATVIISRPAITAGDMIISFAYFFVFILLFSNIALFILRKPKIRSGIVLNFRQKLQISFIGILLFSFILIGIVVAYLTITGYKTKHYDNIKEKLSSVYMELDSRLSMNKHIDRKWSDENYSSLNELLISLSNIFNTDINLYDLNGELIATSRPEIFTRNLTSTRMNNMALIYLSDFSSTEYFQKEKIGNLEYLSAYTPFFNTNDQKLAYLNLPYFRIQSVLAQEISNLIVAVINFTLLLILITMSLAVVISGRLTTPLSMLSEGLASVELGKKTKHLEYKGNDEIAELVRQYNRMVDELEASASKLANSEREYAWREMARQIAHEIKNPLTPMKLNVQQLLKSWRDKAPGFEEKIEKYARNQIEYIDNLSSIASSFSSFAKMPAANPSEVNLIDQLRITLDIFREEQVTFNVNLPENTKVVVYADKEHLNGIFSNLIKNSIQSLPPDREGIIDVVAEIKKDKVIVSIRDNGTGISRDIQKKLFTPNFTTKSSGMGLGLSIVRKYVETANGRIWFESEDNRGTAFFVELPLRYTIEKRAE